LGVVVPGPVRACPGLIGLLTASVVHLLRMDATTQITPTFLTQRELAELLRMPERTLEDWRLMQTGPPYIKLGRLVRYDVQDVLTWVHEHRHG
jgi:predicted DNA-binding transcriptional regulator AlpA